METSHPKKSFSLTAIMADKSQLIQVDPQLTNIEEVMLVLESAFRIAMNDHCLTYIDSDSEYIIVKDEEEWQLYLEEYLTFAVSPTYRDRLYVFKDDEVLTTKVMSDMIDMSLMSSFADLGNRNVAEVCMDEEMKSQIASELAGNSALMTPVLRSKISYSPQGDQLDTSEFMGAVVQSLRSIIDEKVKSGEVQVSQTPIRSVLLSTGCSNCSRTFTNSESFYLDGENSSIKLCSTCIDLEAFRSKTLFTCVPGVKQAEMSEDGFEVIARPRVALPNPGIAQEGANPGTSLFSDYEEAMMGEFPIRLVFTQLQHKKEDHQRKVDKLKRKGVKFIKKEVKKIEKVGKSIIKGVKKMFGS